ncbi:MAG: hypothetical protein Q8942_06400 [Bacillota bacterium]|nr:hypothetical protein [Bacillota bacterium]
MRNSENSKRNLLRQLRDDQEDLRNAGKSFIYFLVGMGLMAGGLFLIFQNTIISTNFTLMNILGYTPPTGIIILPLLLGIGVLFFNEKSKIGWFLAIFGIVSILLELLMGLRMHFKPITLYYGILMFGMTFAGAGLFLKAFIGAKRKRSED